MKSESRLSALRLLASAAAIAVVVPAAFLPALAAGKGEPGPVTPVEILIPDRRADLKVLTDLGIDVDGVYFDRVRAYVVPEEAEKLAALGFALAPIPDEAKLTAAAESAFIPSTYHTYATLTSELAALAAARPDLVRVSSIGQSVQGRELWMVKITDNPGVEEDEPEVLYIAAIHGDEVVGKEMCIELIHYLVDNYGVIPRVTSLIDESEIWILPSMNPDGTELVQRYNANNFDLNRSFPDQFTDAVDSPAGRPVEVQHVMNWGYANYPVLSANFHGGTEVANYPYDGNAGGTNDYSASPEDGLLVSLSRSYANPNPTIFASNADAAFFNGITNGADWYVVRGGMQDWNFVWRGGIQLTLELTTTKWPAGSTLPGHWNDNRESMLAYFERAQQGIRGVVRDANTGLPLPATVKVVGGGLTTLADPALGDYHQILLPGTYTLEVSAPSHTKQWIEDVVVGTGPAARRDVFLRPTAVSLQPIAHRVLDGGNGALDPGETSDLALTLKNLGNSGTVVSATLIPTSPYASVPRATASYPSIFSNSQQESSAPYYSVALSPATPAGHKVGFGVKWQTAQGSGVSGPYFVSAGARTCTTIASSDVPKSVNDRSIVASTINFPTDLEIEEVNVYTNVTHPYKGDLAIYVVSPAGTAVLLHNHSGASGDNVTGWFDTNLGTFEQLSKLEGEHAQGAWNLKVEDAFPANTGSLAAWSLEVCGRAFEAATPEMKFRAFTRTPDSAVAQLEWWRYPGLTSYRVYRSTSPSSAAAFVDVTAEDADPTDTTFTDQTTGPLVYFLVTGVGQNGEGPRGHFGQ